MGTDLGKFVVGWLTWATSIYEMLGGSRKIDEQILDLSKKQTQAEVHAELTEPSLVSETPNKASTIVDVFGGGSLTDEQLGISGDINADRAVEAGEAAIATLDTFGEAFIGVDDLGKNISAAGESIGKWWEGLNLFGADLSYLEGKNISGTISTGQGTVYIDNTTIFNGDNLPIEDIVKQEEEDSENIGTGFSRGIAAQQEDT